MKNLIRILVWTLIALVIQQGIFFYIENVYLSANEKIEAEKVDDTTDSKDNKADEIKIKEGIKQLTVSSDGRFIAYLENGKLKILDSNDNSEKEFEGDDSGEIAFYKWLTNESNIIVIEKISIKGKNYFKPVSFDAKKGETRELSDFDMNELKIPLSSLEDSVDNVVFSTATHSLYIKINKSNGKSDLYYANVMNELTKVKSNQSIGNVVVPTTSTNAVMEIGNNITVLNNKNNISIPKVESPKILGVDTNDNVYFGDEINGQISKIYYAVLSEKNIKWNIINLSQPIDKQDIIIDYSGKIYVNNKLDKNVLELKSKKEINYEGDFLQVYSKGIITNSNNTLKRYQIEDNTISINK